MEVAIELVLSALGAVGFTVVGLLVEWHSLLRLVGGEFALGAWLGCIGLVALYAGTYLLGYKRVVAQLAVGSS